MRESLLEQGMLNRPRLHALIEEGLEYPLLVVFAGPGYGKTQAMAHYVSKTEHDTLWLRLTDLDNTSTHFWGHVVQSLQAEQPDLAQSLRTLGFPYNFSSFDAFIHLLKEHRTERELLWIFDDFGAIKNKHVIDFFRMLASSELQNFSLVLITNDLAHLELLTYLSNRQHFILQKDLRFTQDEIAKLYEMHGMTLDGDELGNIEQQTEGWPLSLHLLAGQNNKTPDTLFNNENAISYLFEARYFAPYTKEQRTTLLKLSLLRYFTMELAAELGSGDALDLEELTKHSFFAQEGTTGHLSLHYLYNRFLQRKQYLLTHEEKLQAWEKAAAYYQAHGDALEAVACYANGEDYTGMLDAMGDYLKAQTSIVDKNAGFLMKYLDLIPQDEVQNYPFAQYLRAWVCTSMVQLDQAEALARTLEEHYLGDTSPSGLSMQGEVQVLLGFINAMRGEYDFGDYFAKAHEFLPEGSRFLGTRGVSTLLNSHDFSLANNGPGAKEDMERAAHYGMPKLARVMNGCNSGSEHIFSAEAAYLSYELGEATEHAYRAIYSAQANGLHDLVCNGHFVLAQVGLLQGDFESMTEQVMSIDDYSRKHNIGVLKEIRDTAFAWYYLQMQDYHKIPRSILSADYLNKPVMAYGRVEITYAQYLLRIGEFAKLVGMLEHPRGFFIAGGIRYDRIYLFVLLAIGYYELGNNEAAIEALWTAYDMCFNNGLITPFIEGREHMPGLLEAIENQEDYTFDAEWRVHISREATAFAERSKLVLSAYQQKNPDEVAKDNPLTKREREVLLALSQGLTREEISLKQFVSINTIKSTIGNIYTKLNAKNRAEAVSIALASGYI